MCLLYAIYFITTTVIQDQKDYRAYVSIQERQAPFRNIQQIVSDDNKIYCVNENDEVLVYDSQGHYEGVIEAPFQAEIYVYNGILCIRNYGKGIIHGQVLMYDDCKYKGKIVPKSQDKPKTNIEVFNEKGTLVYTKQINNDYEIICYDKNHLYFENKENSVEDQINQFDITQSNGIKFIVDLKMRQKLIRIDTNGEKTIIVTQDVKDFVLYSDIIPKLFFGGVLLFLIIVHRKQIFQQIRKLLWA
jgi:hypothetical protein